MVRFLLRRIASGVGVVVAVTVAAYGGWRLLVPQQFPGESLAGGTWNDLKQAAQLHFAVPYWSKGLQADVWMVAGTLAMGMTLGVAAGGWCATHPRTRRARALEWSAMVLYCLPPFVAGFGTLLLFDPSFGVIHVPALFAVHVYQEPYRNPWNWLRSLLVPWIVAGLPLFGATLRITLSGTREVLTSDFMRTAVAKGLPYRLAVRRHGRTTAMPAVFGYLSTSSAAVLLNVIITESIFSVPGTLGLTRRALGLVGASGASGIATLQLVAIWGALLVVVIGIVFDIALAARDPRIRTAGRPG